MKHSTKKKILNIAIILLISIVCTFYFAGSSLTLSNILLNLLYGSLIGLSIAFGSSLISRRIFKSEHVYERPTAYFAGAVGLVSLFILMDVIFVNYCWFKFTQDIPFDVLIRSNFILYTITIEFVIGLIIYLIALARFFTRDLKSYYTRVSEAENQLSKYRYDTLKNQLNPHFLFNALNTLSGLIYLDREKADEFVHRLSKLYRYILDIQNETVVPIETELELVQDFLYLNNIRFNQHIQVEINRESAQGYVVPMALQLLLENAIKHNTISESAPLKIQIFAREHQICVMNAIQLKLEKEPSHEMGLQNLKARYASLTEQEVKVSQDDKQFTVCIPILKNAEE